MSNLFLQLRAGLRLAVYDECGNAELVDIDNQRDEDGNLVVTDHVYIPNTFGGDEIYDDVAAHFRGQSVNALPVAASGTNDHNFFPALMEQIPGSPVKAVA